MFCGWSPQNDKSFVICFQNTKTSAVFLMNSLFPVSLAYWFHMPNEIQICRGSGNWEDKNLMCVHRKISFFQEEQSCWERHFFYFRCQAGKLSAGWRATEQRCCTNSHCGKSALKLVLEVQQVALCFWLKVNLFKAMRCFVPTERFLENRWTFSIQWSIKV